MQAYFEHQCPCHGECALFHVSVFVMCHKAQKLQLLEENILVIQGLAAKEQVL